MQLDCDYLEYGSFDNSTTYQRALIQTVEISSYMRKVIGSSPICPNEKF